VAVVAVVTPAAVVTPVVVVAKMPPPNPWVDNVVNVNVNAAPASMAASVATAATKLLRHHS
jgi:hypothetical protein